MAASFLPFFKAFFFAITTSSFARPKNSEPLQARSLYCHGQSLSVMPVTAEIAALDAGHQTEPTTCHVTARRERSQMDADLRPPYLLPEGGKPAFWWRWAIPVPELTEQRDAGRLHGMGVNSGRITAVARVLRGIEEAGRLGLGEILVTRSTTPAWTPLFARAAGLVTDLGGPPERCEKTTRGRHGPRRSASRR